MHSSSCPRVNTILAQQEKVRYVRHLSDTGQGFGLALPVDLWNLALEFIDTKVRVFLSFIASLTITV
jgi:hypothetical protein